MQITSTGFYNLKCSTINTIANYVWKYKHWTKNEHFIWWLVSDQTNFVLYHTLTRIAKACPCVKSANHVLIYTYNQIEATLNKISCIFCGIYGMHRVAENSWAERGAAGWVYSWVYSSRTKCGNWVSRLCCRQNWNINEHSMFHTRTRDILPLRNVMEYMLLG